MSGVCVVDEGFAEERKAIGIAHRNRGSGILKGMMSKGGGGADVRSPIALSRGLGEDGFARDESSNRAFTRVGCSVGKAPRRVRRLTLVICHG